MQMLGDQIQQGLAGFAHAAAQDDDCGIDGQGHDLHGQGNAMADDVLHSLGALIPLACLGDQVGQRVGDSRPEGFHGRA